MSQSLNVVTGISVWSIANAATRDVETPAALLTELAHAMFNVTVYENEELEEALREAISADDIRRRALASLGALLTAAARATEVTPASE